MNYPPTTTHTVTPIATPVAHAIHSQVGGLPMTGGSIFNLVFIALLLIPLGATAWVFARGRR